MNIMLLSTYNLQCHLIIYIKTLVFHNVQLFNIKCKHNVRLPTALFITDCRTV